MDKLDFYFKQIVSQSEMDQVFDWAEEADHAIMQSALSDPTASEEGGIVFGGDVAEQTVPDLTVAISGISGWDKTGRRVYDATPSVNADCSVDEYGTDTVVSAGGESRIISIFTRFKTDLQNPATDGNGLTVYTRQIESMEYFVRMGTSAVSPTPPPLLSDALLLVDITRAQGQTTIQNTDMDFARREDWVRFTGSTISSFVHGSPKEAIRALFGYVDTGWGGGIPFTFSQDWYGSVAPGVVGGSPPTDVKEALDAIVQDLASNAGAGGDSLIGAEAITGTAGGYGDLSAANVSGHLASIAALIADHVDGGAPQHPADAIDTDAYQDFEIGIFDSNSAFSAGGTMTNSAGGQASVVGKWISPDSSTYYVLMAEMTGSWPSNVGVDAGSSYSAPPDTYYRDDIYVGDIMTGADLQATLQKMVETINLKSGITNDDHITGNRTSFGYNHHNHFQHINCLTVGGGNPLNIINELEDGYPIDNADGMWGHAYSSVTTCQASNLVDIARGFDFKRQRPCVYAVGDNAAGEVVICKIFMDEFDSNFINDEYAICTGDASGTSLTTLNANAEAYAVCSNGDKIFLLAQASASGASARVHCYDARSFVQGGSLTWLWTWNPGALTGALGTRKTDSRIRVVGDYVFALFGNERCDTTSPGTPLGRCDVSDGTGGITGIGDGYSGATLAKPYGGLYVSREYDVFYSCGVDSADGETVAATPTLAATGFTQMATSEAARDVIIPGGRYAFSPGHGVVGYYWDWDDDVQQSFSLGKQDPQFSTGEIICDFDGTKFWTKFPIDDGDAGSGENFAVFGMHPAQLRRRNTSGSWTLDPPPIYMINEPRSTIGPAPSGRICAWGPGIFNLAWENNSAEVSFLPFSRLQ